MSTGGFIYAIGIEGRQSTRDGAGQPPSSARLASGACRPAGADGGVSCHRQTVDPRPAAAGVFSDRDCQGAQWSPYPNGAWPRLVCYHRAQCLAPL
jgi:hypothetical protein